MRHHLSMIQVILFTCCDIIGQLILVRTSVDAYYSIYSLKHSKIYRCWIVWGRSIRVVIVPLFLVFAFLGLSMIFLITDSLISNS